MLNFTQQKPTAKSTLLAVNAVLDSLIFFQVRTSLDLSFTW